MAMYTGGKQSSYTLAQYESCTNHVWSRSLQFRKLCACTSFGTTVIPAVLFKSDQSLTS